MTSRVIALALIGLGAASTGGCSRSACEDLVAAADAGGCATGPEGAAEAECTEEAEKSAQCYLDSVADICRPTSEDLATYTECVG